MANKYFIEDQGDVIYYNGEVWRKNGTTTSISADSSMNGITDIGYISSVTFRTPDSYGRTLMSAEQMAVALYKYSYYGPGGGGWQIVCPSVPAKGVARCRVGYTISDIRVRVNGGTPITFGFRAGIESAYPIDVNPGDLLEIDSYYGGGIIYIIPDTYPNPG